MDSAKRISKCLNTGKLEASCSICAWVEKDSNFLSRIVTKKKLECISKTQKQGSNLWDGDSMVLQYLRNFIQKSAGKVSVSVFWNWEGIIIIDLLEKGRITIENYHSKLGIIDRRRRRMSECYHRTMPLRTNSMLPCKQFDAWFVRAKKLSRVQATL